MPIATHRTIWASSGSRREHGHADSPRSSTRRGKSTATYLLALALLGAGCTYSDGSMNHDSTPHSHGAGGAHPAGAHSHTSAGDGLSAELHGYALEVTSVTHRAARATVSFRIRNETGAPQLQYALDHGKLLHLYVVSEDLAEYQHVHPSLDSSGSWTADLPALRPGVEHVVASFVAIDDTGGEHALVLGTDLLVAGEARRTPLPPPAETVSTDGLDVRLSGDLIAGQTTSLALTVTRDGRAEPLLVMLQSWAHVTAVHADTRSLTHLHPDGVAEPGDRSPRQVDLVVNPAEPGTYRIFVDFATASGEHRVAFTREVCC
jgi:hypothetical protein